MSAWWVVPLIASIVALVIALVAWRPVRAAMRENELAKARRDFHRQREHLEARFMRLAGQSGKPRGLEWVRCDFDDDVIYARHRQSGEVRVVKVMRPEIADDPTLRQRFEREARMLAASLIDSRASVTGEVTDFT